MLLTAGSLAYDYLYTFPGVFQDKLLNEHSGCLSIAFNVTDKAVNFGGCAGNIAYNARLLGENFAMLGIAGRDFGDYDMWLRRHGIDTKNVILETSQYTSQAAVVTDKKGQQITFFHEGAASKSSKHKKEISKTIKGLAGKVRLAIISPNNREFILACVNACKKNRIPFIFDPGQAMPVFSAAELAEILKYSCGVFLNEYELAMLEKELKMPWTEILKICPLIIVTLGEKGSRIHFGEKEIFVPSKRVAKPKDPTGCGDAYRAGFLSVFQHHFLKLSPKALEKAGKTGTKLALACLNAVGTQNHVL